MHVIAALMADGPAEIWKTPQGLDILRRSRRLLQARADESLTAVTDDPALAPVLEQAGFPRVSLAPRSGPADQACDWFKPALRHASDRGLRGGVLFFNLRNPLLDENALARGLRDFAAAPGRAVVSVVPLSDHPCQFFIGFNVLDMGLVHVFDGQRRHEGRVATRPFAFDWSSRSVGRRGAPGYARRCGPLGVFYAPAEEGPVLLAEGPDAARYSVPAPACPESPWQGWEPAGRTFRGREDFPRVSLWRRPGNDETRLHLRRDPAWRDRMLLRLFVPAFTRRSQQTYDFELCPGGEPFIAPAALADANCFGYALLAVCENEACEIDEAYDLADDLWTHERLMGRIMNCATGEEITGRQGFPRVLGPDGSFFLIDAGRGAAFEDDILDGRAVGCLLDEKASFQIRTKVDVLRLRLYGKDAPWETSKAADA